MNEQQIRALFLAIDLLISHRTSGKPETFEKFINVREEVVRHALLAMKIKEPEIKGCTDE